MSGSHIVWRRASRGLTCIGIGVFCLLSTQGLLYRGFWLDALSLWPVLLITMGVGLVFGRSRTPWAVLLSPLIIMTALGYVAWRGPAPRPTDWVDVQAVGDPGVKTWTLDANVALADLDLRVGSLAPNVLAQGRTSAHNANVRVSDRGNSSRVSLGSQHWQSGGVHLLPRRRESWDIDVTNTRPLRLRLSTAFADGELDFQTTQVTRVDHEGAFNDFILHLGEPRTDTRVNLDGAFNQLELVVPVDTPVRVSRDGFINLVDRRPNGRARSGPAYRVHSEGAFNRVVIRSE